MNIFLTGATGYIGSAVASALRKNNHEVTALVRPDADSGKLRELGVAILGGDLESLPSLREQLGGFDAFVHTAQSRQNTVAADRNAIDTFIGLGGHVLFTSGVWVVGNTTSADETTPAQPLDIVAWRPPHEQIVLDAGGAVLRPGVVYGGRQSICADWFAAAEQKRATTLVGDGRNRWAMVHISELADLYVRIVEQRASGMLHGIDDSDATLDESMRAVSPDLEIQRVPLEKARETMGSFADALAVDQRIFSKITREKTAWTPRLTFTSSVAQQWQEWREAQKA
ncbi:MAG TPA: NAD-dependent epimerase/dehydratase family protein [Thermoanaerobaculia bacterium]|nr:NAD-dependent epimerase/dehydratase family protein [Thermoanaerobaculia bacterium]